MANDPDERTRFIEHRGTEILLFDFGGFTDLDEALRCIHASRSRILGRAPRSVRTLVNVKDSRYDTRVARALQDLARHNKPFVAASAVVGLSGLQRVILSAVMRATGRTFATFDDVEAAKDWLVAQ